MASRTFSSAYIADYVQGRLVGSDLEVDGIGTLANATSSQLSFLANSRYRSSLTTAKAGVVLVGEADLPLVPNSAIVVANPYLAYAKISQLYAGNQLSSGVAKSAAVAVDAVISSSAQICDGVVIESGAQIGDSVYIGPNSVIGAGAVIGNHTRIAANVSIYNDVQIGENCLIHSGAVIGADGFGFAPDSGRWEKIAQLGRVIIGNDVEVGAGTTIDRGALDDTLIEDGVKLDNQIQIAHNVIIGENSAIAGGCAIAGSTRIGKQCTIAGMSGVTGHLEIADGTHITAMTLVSRSITEPGAYSSGTAFEPHKQWKRNAVRFRQLDELTKRVSELEKLVEQLSSKDQD